MQVGKVNLCKKQSLVFMCLTTVVKNKQNGCWKTAAGTTAAITSIALRCPS